MALGRKPIEIVNDGKHQLLAKAEHWDRIYLKEVAKVQNGYAFSSDYFTKSNGMPLIRIRDIDSYGTVDKFSGKYSDDFVVKKGDILIGMDGDFRVARWKGEKALLNQRVCRIIPNSKDYNEKFLVFCLQPFLDAIHAETSSVTVKHISSKTIEEIPLPLPPKKEQDAIVSKIEELFSELDKGIENLRIAQQQLKTYRQSVLKWAFEGKLTNENVKEGELPKGWIWETMENVTNKITDGEHLTPKRIKEGEMLLSAKNVRDGYIDYENFDCISKADFDKCLLRCNPEVGDVLIVSVGATIGRASIVREKRKFALVRSVALLKPKEVISEFLLYFIQSPQTQKQIQHLSQGSAQSCLYINKIKQIVTPLPKVKEQQKIVQEIESRLSVADKMEESITKSLQQAEALRQSILKKAFEGKLV